MPERLEMLAGARILVDTLTDVKPGEQVLIVLDTATSYRIAEVAAEATREREGARMAEIIGERLDGIQEIISELRGVLDDLAKETGGRKQKHEVGGALTINSPVTVSA